MVLGAGTAFRNLWAEPDLLSAPQLPSGRFRFASWQHLQLCDVTGDQLSCPRVRKGVGVSTGRLSTRDNYPGRTARFSLIVFFTGPSEEQPFEGDSGLRRREQGQSWEERLQENWENCLVNEWAGPANRGVRWSS